MHPCIDARNAHIYAHLYKKYILFQVRDSEIQKANKICH